MSNPIEPEKVRQVAKLARISIDDDQLAGSSQQLNQILQYVDQLQQVDLPDDVQPFFGAIESVNAIRADQCVRSTERDKILENAPDSDGEFYQVPPVFK